MKKLTILFLVLIMVILTFTPVLRGREEVRQETDPLSTVQDGEYSRSDEAGKGC